MSSDSPPIPLNQQEIPKKLSDVKRSLALDGIRGSAIMVLLLYHFGWHTVQGAWVGISVFFFFSGYVIVVLLTKSYVDTGHVPVKEFYQRRMQRLLPALFLLLGVLTIWALVFANDSIRSGLKGDLLATLGFVQNWHLISNSDQYFTVVGNPSFLRHAWTLAVEEQFYLLAPFVVAFILLKVKRRWQRVGLMIAASAASSWRAAAIGTATTADMTWAYYSTDTRMAALFAGVAAAFWFGPDKHGNRPRLWPYPVVFVVGWTSMIITVASVFVVKPMAPIMFEGWGLFWIGMLLLVGVPIAVDKRPSMFKKIFSWTPIVYLGTMIYGIYLWHWPVKLWLDMYWPSLDGWGLQVVGVSSTLIIAALSFKFLEIPVMFGGVKALFGSARRARIATWGTLAALIVGAFMVGNVPTVEQRIEAGDIPTLNSAQPPYVPGDTTTRVAFYGDSIPMMMANAFPAPHYPDIKVTNLAHEGCDLVWWPNRYVPEFPKLEEQCAASRAALGPGLKKDKVQTLVVLAGTALAVDRYTPERKLVTIKSPEYVAEIRRNLDEILAIAQKSGVTSMQLSTLPCRDTDVGRLESIFQIDPADYASLKRDHAMIQRLADPVGVNAVFKQWARDHGVHILDLYSALDCANGFAPNINGIEMYSDYFHFTPEANAMIWTWLAPEVRANASIAAPGPGR
jgi:peptidoglycan/LPS O-acetylase OafA/YrhL